MVLNCFVCSKKGNFRDKNEDNLFLNGKYLGINHSDVSFNEKIKADKCVLTGVFDGLGGERRGEEASYRAAAVLGDYDGEINIEEYFKRANREICMLSNENKPGRTGSTAAVICFMKGEFIAANIGDSRIYLIRDNNISRLSVDHTMIETMINSGVLKREETHKSKFKNYLTRCLGVQGEAEGSAYIAERAVLKEGDIFILCSDGLSGVMEDGEILKGLSECERDKNPALQLAEKAYEAGSRDNTTLIVIYCENKEKGLFGRLFERIF